MSEGNKFTSFSPEHLEAYSLYIAELQRAGFIDHGLRFVRLVNHVMICEFLNSYLNHETLLQGYRDQTNDQADARDAGFLGLDREEESLWTWGESLRVPVGGEGTQDRRETDKLLSRLHTLLKKMRE